MTLAELLDETARYRLRDRSDQISGVGDNLWPDEVLVRYLNQAQEQFCRRTHALTGERDVTLVVDTASYTLPTDMFMVYSGRVTGQNNDLRYDRNRRVALPATTKGTPRYMDTDDPSKTLRVYPTPDATGTLILFGALLPTVLDINTPNQESDVPSQYHEALVDYAVFKALSNRDVDGGAVGDSDRARVMFDTAVTLALVEVGRGRAGNLRNAGARWA
jgi:hypothetical protein